MAAVAKSGTPILSSVLPQQDDQLQCIAAVAIAAGDACYLSAVASNGQPVATPATGTAANAAARARGIAAAASAAGEAVTLYRSARFRYGASLATTHGIGSPVYLATVAGGLDSAATTGGVNPIGFIVDETRIQFDLRA